MHAGMSKYWPLMKFTKCLSELTFVSQGQITQPPSVINGQAVTEKNVSLFTGKLDNCHYNALLSVEDKLSTFRTVLFLEFFIEISWGFMLIYTKLTLHKQKQQQRHLENM
jgi:hypothetical protein